ncbi:hypothetical protein J0X19_13825 [Hymenobacter sp. BT186]|uniref:Uncharacterized protein n=1 Tax=Hymenobacter telluris TaxID=2816474 RepID=A0A939F052_9BACT|nr:hypothetical protein [Hymenobacter telluris]MBO0359033.1 hypothetical protein [Hymenobacter telluris]MBW3375059.1 hypothetical protein [Hymenobacter norwichensis]
MTDSAFPPPGSVPPDGPPANAVPPEPDPAAPLAISLPPVGPPPLPPPQQFAVVQSEDGRLMLTNDALIVHGQSFGWWELEGAEVKRVRWLLWLLLGGFTLAGFLLGFLQNWLRTMPAALGMTVGALLLAFGQRGTNRLQLHRLGREAINFALPGELATWQKLTAEINRRIRQRQHETAAAATAALLAAQANSTDTFFAAE